MEYKALNLVDEVCTVEITVQEDKRMLHILDLEDAVSPSYNFVEDQFVLSDDFQKMALVLKRKNILLFQNNYEVALEKWLKPLIIIFYRKKSILHVYSNGVMKDVEISFLPEKSAFHLPYVERVKEVL